MLIPRLAWSFMETCLFPILHHACAVDIHYMAALRHASCMSATSLEDAKAARGFAAWVYRSVYHIGLVTL
jgi:hypothetical protein